MSAPARPDRAGYLFAFGAAAAYGTNAVLNRAGLERYGTPLAAVVISLVAGVLALAPLAWGAYRAQEAGWRPGRRAVGFILASGLSAIVGYSANILALSLLPVVVVAPISSAYPLVTVFLVRLFLRTEERVNRRTVLGAVLVVAGVALVTLSR